MTGSVGGDSVYTSSFVCDDFLNGVQDSTLLSFDGFVIEPIFDNVEAETLQLLRRSDFPHFTDELFNDIRETKVFQHDWLSRQLSASVRKHHAIADIGAKHYFKFLKESSSKSKAVIDPYMDAIHGGGTSAMMAHLMPYPLTIYRCHLGIDSHIIPSDNFDVTFSCSVLEHIGQTEANYDCRPVEVPPTGQEAPRNALASEMFRITKPGGVTMHTIDHGARNLTWIDTLVKAGFEPYPTSRRPSVDYALTSPDLVREKQHWTTKEPFSEDEQRLHAVLFVKMVKPV